MAKCLGALLTGTASRSEKTAAAHRLLRDGHGTQEEFTARISEDASALTASQENFAFRSSGQLDWLDLFRPLARSFGGFELRASPGEDAIGPVTRWFRTNTFYRRPLVSGKIDCKGDELEKHLPPTERGLVLIAGPYTFSKLVQNSHYANEGEMAIDYSRAIAKNLVGLKSLGYGCVLILEPSVGFALSTNSYRFPSWYNDAISEIKKAGLTTGIHFPLADASLALSDFEGTTADFLGVDAIYTKPGTIQTKKDLLLGVLDGARASLERKEDVLKQLNSFISGAKFSGNYYIGPNDRLFDVPFGICVEKIKLLSALSTELRGIEKK